MNDTTPNAAQLEKPSRPSTLAELEAKRGGVLATGPSGVIYRIRKPHLQRHLEAGQLPTALRAIAQKAIKSNGEMDVKKLVEAVDPETGLEQAAEDRDLNDRLVLATVIDPELAPEHLGTGELDDDPVLPAIDYDWLLLVAHGRTVRDATGRRLWGPEPLDSWWVFQETHKCDRDNCEGCLEAASIYAAASVPAGGLRDA